MTLVDTSVWVSHLSSAHAGLSSLLVQQRVLIHPFVMGELACGSLKNRAGVLNALRALSTAVRAKDEEVLGLVERHRLWGKGIGWVDAHLIASSLLSHSELWTLDRRMAEAATLAGARLSTR